MEPSREVDGGWRSMVRWGLVVCDGRRGCRRGLRGGGLICGLWGEARGVGSHERVIGRGSISEGWCG